MWPGLTTPEIGGQDNDEVPASTVTAGPPPAGSPEGRARPGDDTDHRTSGDEDPRPGRAGIEVQARLSEAVRRLGADAGVVALVAGRSLVRVTSVGYEPDAFGSWPLPLTGPGPLVGAAAAVRPAWIAGGDELRARYPELAAPAGMDAGAFIPLVADGRILGVLGVTFRGRHRWDPAEQALLGDLALALTPPLRRLDREDRRRRVADQLDALGAEPSLQARLDRAARLVAGGLDDDIVMLALASPDGEWLERFGIHHPDPIATDELRRLLGERARVGENRATRLLLEGQQILVPDIDPAAFRAATVPRLVPFFEQWPVHGTVAVPLPGDHGDDDRDAGDPVGLVIALRLRADDPYDGADQAWLEEVAGRLDRLRPPTPPDDEAATRRLLPLAGRPAGLALAVGLPALLTPLLHAIALLGQRPSAGYLTCIAAVAAVAGRREAAVATLASLGLYATMLASTTDPGLVAATLVILAVSATFVVLVVNRLERAARSLVDLERREAERRFEETTERLAAAERQALADSRFRSLVEATSAVTWRADAQGELIEPQPGWEAYTGQAWAEQAGRGWGAMIHPDDRPAVEEAWERSLRDGSGVFEAPLRLWSARHQEHRHAVARAAPLRDRHGTILEWIGAVSDIHDQVQAEQEQDRLARELSESRARLAGLMEADVLAFIFGEDDLITHANDAFLTLLGRTREDLESGRLRWTELTPPGWEEVDEAALAQLAETGRADPYEKEYLDAEGRRVRVEIGIVALSREPLRWTAFVVDLRERNAVEERLREAYAQRDHVARTLQTSLLPPRLPEPDGLRLAARYLPSPVGEGVGGDFYDVYPSHGGRWHVAIGDVCGRGTDAAALTALSRYTLRAAAIASDDPAEILHVLNDAVRSTVEDGRFCTVAYTVVRPLPDSRWHATVTLGGHHCPRLLRGGEVQRLGRPGTLIGVFPDPVFASVELELEPGDIVVAFTDGLIEQQRPPFDERDLDDLLRGLAARGADLETVVAEVEARVAPEHVRDDDTAILAVAVG